MFVDAFIKIYSILHCKNKFINLLLTPFRRIVRCTTNCLVPINLKKSIKGRGTNYDDSVVVSLTSFPARIETIWQVVTCLLLQSQLPKKVVLWLSQEQFQDRKSLPNSLLSLENDIFEIRFVEGDIKSHKKYYYVLQEFKDDIVILVDDDIYYPTNMIAKLMNVHRENPDAIVARYGYNMRYDKEDNLLPYRQWDLIYGDSKSQHIFFGSGGGTLIPPGALYKDVCEKDLFLSLTPSADDIWLNTMAYLNNTSVIKVSSGLLLPVKNNSKSRLATLNVEQDMNDKQIKAVCAYYQINMH